MIYKKVLIDELKKIDHEFTPDNLEIHDNNIIASFSEKNIKSNNTVAVLGLDIYRYSEYEENKQNLIPFIFDMILDETLEIIKKSDMALFGNNVDIKKRYISTGDGAFIIFGNRSRVITWN